MPIATHCRVLAYAHGGNHGEITAVKLLIGLLVSGSALVLAVAPPLQAHEVPVDEIDVDIDRIEVADRLNSVSVANFRGGLGLDASSATIEDLRARFISGQSVTVEFGSFLTTAEAEAVRKRLHQEHSFSLLAERLEGDPGFAGAWVEGALGEERYVIAQVSGGLSDQGMTLIGDTDLDVEVVVFDHSWADLVAAKATIVDRFGSMNGVWGVSIDPRINGIEVSIDQRGADIRILEALEDDAEHPPVVFDFAAAPVEENHTRFHIGSGGVMLAGQHDTGSVGCTLSWAMTTGPSGSGATRGMSAGHCYDNGTSWSVGSTSYGTRLHQYGLFFNNTEDVMTITLAS